MTKDDIDDLPDKDAAKEFYAKYEPKEILGRGISSTVRRCIEKETGAEYAAKIIDISSEPEALACTREEIKILRLVAVFELCRNGELFDFLTSVVTLTEKKTRTLMRQLFEALIFVHEKNIVHRDLKPENILLDEQNDIKLTDFGFARILEGNELLFDLRGTPGYLAPEVLKANMYEDQLGYGMPVDAWACGVIMYTLLVGCPPFWHRKQIIMIRNIMEGRYSFASPEWSDVSSEAKDLITKLLVVDPNERYTVEAALEHPFFTVTLWDQNMAPIKKSFAPQSRRFSVISQMAEKSKAIFRPKKRFRLGVLCIIAIIRLTKLTYTPKPISIRASIVDPYKIKALRKAIDNCAFRVYGHWVKKDEGQSRAALFEMAPKTELKALYISNISP